MSQFPYICALVQLLNIHALWIEAYLSISSQKHREWVEGFAKLAAEGSQMQKDAVSSWVKKTYEQTRLLPALRERAALIMEGDARLAEQQEIRNFGSPVEAKPVAVVQDHEFEWKGSCDTVRVSIDRMTVKELREELRHQGLKLAGRKAELQARLRSNLPA